jgi:6-phosphogluconolactonase
MTSRRKGLTLLMVLTLLFSFGAVLSTGTSAFAKDTTTGRDTTIGAVYTITNAADKNEVAIFARSHDGSLSFAGKVATGGKGLGAGLGSQGAITLSQGNRWLFVVNAGSNSISAFKVKGNGLELTDTEPSGGVQPVSVTSYDHLLYVLNAGGTDNITGFRVTENGKLIQIPGSTHALSSTTTDTGPAQVAFNPEGDALVVTEKATNNIDVFRVADNGKVFGPHIYPSHGQTPFGFTFDGNRRIIVTEAHGGPGGAGALSSYHINKEGLLETISASVPTQQNAACWVVLSKDGKYAYTANTPSNSLSSFLVSPKAQLKLQTSVVATTAAPTDATFSPDGKFLYVLNSSNGGVSIYAPGANGALISHGDGGFSLQGHTAGIAAW